MSCSIASSGFFAAFKDFAFRVPAVQAMNAVGFGFFLFLASEIISTLVFNIYIWGRVIPSGGIKTGSGASGAGGGGGGTSGVGSAGGGGSSGFGGSGIGHICIVIIQSGSTIVSHTCGRIISPFGPTKS